MNHGNQDDTDMGKGSSNNNPQRKNQYTWHTRKYRYSRVPAEPTVQVSDGQSLKVESDSIQSSRSIDSDESMADMHKLVNGLLAGEDDIVRPVESPVKELNSAVHRENNFIMSDRAASIWQMDINDLNLGNNCEALPYPKCIPTLNGSPYTGVPATSPSPIGSSRGNSRSNSSPPIDISASSSPSTTNLYNLDLRKIYTDLTIIHHIFSSQSSDGGSYEELMRNAESRLSDDANNVFYQTPRSSESISLDGFSVEDFLEELESRESGNSRSSGSSPFNDFFADIHLNNVLPYAADRAESARRSPLFQRRPSSVPTFEVRSPNHSQQRPVMNQPLLPNRNQMGLPNRQFNMPQQRSVTNAFPISGQQLANRRARINPLASLSSAILMNQRVISEQPTLYCAIHINSQFHYCTTCSKLFCTVCTPVIHDAHITTYLADAFENTYNEAKQVIAQCTYGIDIIIEELDAGETAKQMVDVKAHEAVVKVQDMTRRLIEALHAREQSLIESIEASRQSKQQALQKRTEGLNFGISRLQQIAEKLVVSVEASAVALSPLDLIAAKDNASAEIFQVKHMRHNLPPAEKHFIKFQCMENQFLNMIQNLGTVCDGSDRPRPRIPSLTPLRKWSPGYAIPGANFRVSVLNNRASSVNNENPYAQIGLNPENLITELEKPEDNLCRPWGVACDRDGHIVIADRSNNRIQIFHMDGTFVRRFGTRGSGRCQFNRPAGVAVDARRRIVVADKDNHRIQLVTMEGEYILCFGEKGTAPGQFNYPWDVATNEACEIVVSDTRNHRIQLFSAEGTFLRKFGFDTQPHMWKSLDSPRGVAFDNHGNAILTDFNNHRVIVVDADFLSARVLGGRSLAPDNTEKKYFHRPQGVAVDDFGHIIVCDSRNYCVKILDYSGVCLRKFGTMGEELHEMDRPSGVAVAPDGKIVVVDFGNNRVLLF